MKGSAMIAAFMLIVVGSIMVGGYLLYVSNESRMTKMLNDSIKALYIAEAGLERKIYEIGDGDYDDMPVVYFPDISDSNNSYEVTTDQSGSMYIVTSTGKCHLGQRIVQKNAETVSMWGAVFSGELAEGEIEGNTHVRGTVYVLGEESFIDTNENSVYDEGVDILIDSDGDGSRSHLDSSDYAIDGSGTFYIGNNYEQFGGSNEIPLMFSDRVPSLGADETLEAELNVKYGMVNLDGSAQVGNEEVPMDTVNVPDGFPEGDVDDVYTDRLLYDRGRFNEKLRFPNLADAYTDPDTGTTYTTAEGGRLKYLETNGLVLTVGVDIPEAITPGASTDFSITDDVNSFVKTGENLTIDGIIYIVGDMEFDKHGNDKTIYYTGKGSIVVTGDLTINTNLYTANTNADYLDGSAYPEHNVIGFMTPNDIELGTGGGSAQLELMAIFYAGDTIETEKQTSVAGSFISNRLDMSGQVPEIFKIKKVKDNLPPGMIDMPPVLVVDSWHEVYGE